MPKKPSPNDPYKDKRKKWYDRQGIYSLLEAVAARNKAKNATRPVGRHLPETVSDIISLELAKKLRSLAPELRKAGHSTDVLFAD